MVQRKLDKSVRDLNLKSEEVIQTYLEHGDTKIQLKKLEIKLEELELFEVHQNTINFWHTYIQNKYPTNPMFYDLLYYF